MKKQSALFSVFMMLALLVSLVFQVTPAYAAAGIDQDFRNSTAPNWTLQGTAALTAGGVDPAGDGWLQLTSNAGDQAGSAIYNNAFSNAVGIQVSFLYATYGGSGADGFTFYLIDGATGSPTVGAAGGALGYSWNANNPIGPGVTNGYVGIGFDEFGNFTNSNANDYGTGGFAAGINPNRIGIRGPGNLNDAGTFPYLTSVGMPIETGNRAGAKHVVITITPSPTQKISVTVDGIAQITDYDISGYAMPATFKMGFSASTGGSTNYHEIRDLTVTGLTPSTTAVVTSGSPSVVGASVTFTATVSGGTTPTGNVAFYDGATYLGAGALDGAGVATYATSALTAGTHTITAKYLGDSDYATSQGTVAQEVISNVPPVANDDPSYSIHARSTLNGTSVLANDTDANSGDVLTAVLVTGPTQAAAFTLNSNGTFAYTSNTGFVGTDFFTYKANDGIADSNIATVSIDVTNTAPVANPDLYGTHMSVSFPDNVLANDTDVDGDPLTVTLVTPPPHASAFTLNPDGSFSYEPENGYQGEDTFTYKVNDLSVDSTGLATITIIPWTKTLYSIASDDGWITLRPHGAWWIWTPGPGLRMGDQVDKQYRSIISFNTYRALPAGFIILDTKVRINRLNTVGGDPFLTHGKLLADIHKGFFGYNRKLEPRDYNYSIGTHNAIGNFTPAIATTTNPNSAIPNWYEMLLKPQYYSDLNINVTRGLTQFRLRFTKGNDGDGKTDYVRFGSDNSLLNKPELVIQYYVPHP